MALICGFAAMFGTAAPAGAATSSFSLTSASLPGQDSVTWQGPPTNPPATPNVFPSTVSLTGQIDSSTGDISGATLSLPPLPQPEQQGENTTFTFTDSGNATGNFNAATDAVTLNDSFILTFTGTGAIPITCVSKPINVALSGTWDSTTQDVTLATTSSFTIPQFPASSGQNCADAITPPLGTLNSSPGGVAGSVGNAMSLALHGQFAPGLPTTTALTSSVSSPQPIGTSITLTATVTDPSSQGTPTGNVNFLDNGASIGTGVLSSGAATLTTSALPGGTNQLSVSYGGDSTYAGSTSDTQSYLIQPNPTITADVPSSMMVGTPSQFTLTISNPASGQSYPNVYVELLLNGALSVNARNYPTLSYQDSGGNWCPMTAKSSRGWFLSGIGAAPCGTPPSSMDLEPGTTLSIPMEFTYASTPPGTDQLEVALYTGTCSGPITCTAVAPFNSAIGPSNTGPGFVTNYTLQSTTGTGTAATTTSNTYGSSLTLHQGFDLAIKSTTLSNSGKSTGVYGSPTGTVEYFVDGQPAGSAALTQPKNSSTTYTNSTTSGFSLNTANLIPGTHYVVTNYSGDSLFAPSSLTEAFTVLAGPPSGSLYSCSVLSPSSSITGTFNGYVSAAAASVPATAPSGTTVNATAITVSLDVDPILDGFGGGSFVPPIEPSAMSIGFSPDGTTATPSSVTVTGSNSTPDLIATWTGLSTTITATGSPGSTVALGVSSISMVYSLVQVAMTCTPSSQAATVATVSISGNTLVANPSGSSSAGVPITLTDSVSPAPPDNTSSNSWGQVDFYDGTTDLGTVPVVTSGYSRIGSPPLPDDNGTASLAVNSLAVGDHQLTAVWSGNGEVGPNTSNTVDYEVGTQTTTTLVSSANPANAAHSITFTATVSPPPGSTTQPTGDVSFTQDGNPISSCQNLALSMASPPTASCTVRYGAGQSHAIVATYSGDATYIGSTSGTLTQTTLPGTNTTILSTKDPSPAGNVTFWSGVGPSSGSGATPTGAVAFTIDGSVYKPCNAAPLGPGGGASCTVSFKAGTTHKVFATYPGSASYSGSKSSTITQTVTGGSGSTGPKDASGSATLNPGQSLTANQSISVNGYKLVMQSDGNLVEYHGSRALWASGTAGHPGVRVTMQSDGNLVEYQGGHAIWASNTAGHPGAHLTLQGSDGNVVIYTPANKAVWATGT